MIELLERAPEMSVADRTFDPKEEVYTMTALSSTGVRRTRPRGLDRVVMRLSLMALLAARRHADRTAVSYEEHTRLHAERVAAERRERSAATLIARVH